MLQKTARVQYPLGIECRFNGSHHFQTGLAQLLRQVLGLVDADAVLTSQGPSDGQSELDDFIHAFIDPGHLLRIALIAEHKGVQVSISRMGEDRYLNPIAPANLDYFLYGSRKEAHRHGCVFNHTGGAHSGYGAESRAAGKPELFIFLLR
jgi:hypothetical protein